MNHSQFLCYGLLKIFLKEAIDADPNTKGLLCSYFLKTALFWEITTSSNQWGPSSLMSCFWNCFRRLLQWVSCSYCPNFFIPQNNMFRWKIKGTHRDKLLQHMKTLYSEGYMCLLRCPSLFGDMLRIMLIPRVEVVVAELSICNLAENIIVECYRCLNSPFFMDFTTTVKCVLLCYIASSTNSHQRFLSKIWLHQSLSDSCITYTNNNSGEGRCNRSRHRGISKRMNALARSPIDSVSHFLYQAILCYNHEKYNQALRLI